MEDNEEYWVVDEMLGLALRVSQIIGVAPVRFYSRHGRVVHLSRIQFYITILIAIILDGLSIYIVYTKILTDKSDDITSLLHEINFLSLFMTKTCVTLIPLTIFMFYNYYRMKNLFRLYTRITDIKRSVSGNFRPQPKRWRTNCQKVLLVTAPWITMVVALSVTPESKYLSVLSKFIPNNLWLYIEIQFIIFAGIINDTFRSLNERLEEVLTQLDVQSIHNMHIINLTRAIRRLTRNFVSICEVMQKLNVIENNNIFFQFCMLSIILGVHLNLVFGYIANKDIASELVLEEGIWILYNIIRVVLLVESCHETRQLISRTGLLVGKIMYHVTTDNNEYLKAVDNLFKQLILNNLSYEVMGICLVDRHIILLVIGVTTTILGLTI